MKHSGFSSLRDNQKRGTVGSFVSEWTKEGSSLSFVSVYFTIYAYQQLKNKLDKIDHLRFLLGEPRFINHIDPQKSDKKQFQVEDDKLVIPRVILFEMKYKTMSLDQTYQNITYHLKKQGSQNLTRYDVWHDLERCEYILGKNIPSIDKTPTEAYVLLYTNDSSLWSTSANTMSDNLKLEAGQYMAKERNLHALNNPDGRLSEGGVGKFRRDHPIRIANDYDIVWNETSLGF